MNSVALELIRCVPIIGLVSLRVALVIALLPAPFGDVAPVRIRAALAFVLAFVLCLAYFPRFPDVGTSPAELVAAATTELVIGAVIGLTVRVTLAASEIAGSVVGNAIGLGFAASIDPILGGESVPTSLLFNGLASLTFFTVGGHHLVFQALLASLEAAPPGHPLASLHTAEVVAVGSRMVAQGLRIAAPVVATMFIVQLGMALVARAAPRVQIFALTFGVSVSVGALVLVASAPQVAHAIAGTITGLFPAMVRVLQGGAP